MDVTISPEGSTAGTVKQGVALLPLCSTWCSTKVNVGGSEDIVLSPGSWAIEATVNTQGGAEVYFVSIVKN